MENEINILDKDVINFLKKIYQDHGLDGLLLFINTIYELPYKIQTVFGRKKVLERINLYLNKKLKIQTNVSTLKRVKKEILYDSSIQRKVKTFLNDIFKEQEVYVFLPSVLVSYYKEIQKDIQKNLGRCALTLITVFRITRASKRRKGLLEILAFPLYPKMILAPHSLNRHWPIFIFELDDNSSGIKNWYVHLFFTDLEGLYKLCKENVQYLENKIDNKGSY